MQESGECRLGEVIQNIQDVGWKDFIENIVRTMLDVCSSKFETLKKKACFRVEGV